MACFRKSDVAPANVFVDVTAGKKFFNADMKCEYAGNKIAEMVEKGEITTDHAINDCIAYADRINDGKKENHMLCWMCKHLALGLCHKFNVTDKTRVRKIMQDILPLCRGMDAGVFFRDIVAFGEDGQFLSENEKELLEKSMYYLKMCTGFKIDMRDEAYARSIFGPLKAKLPKLMYYIDLPIGNPAYAIGTAPTSTSNPLATACESLKPHAVLTLLRHGANPHGEPLAYILGSLSHAKTVEEKAKIKVAESPVELTKKVLDYLLRVVSQLKLRFDDQKIGETDHEQDVYYVSKNIANFVEERFYRCPNTLKHLCRLKIRQLVLENDSIPEGIYSFQKPLITSHKRYLDLLGK